MTMQVLAEETSSCVWMDAGQIRFRLCDRDFDCEHCPLDAVLRGDPALRPHARRPADPSSATSAVPGDRRYAPGHTWVKELGARGESRCRLGLDGFAAAIVGVATGVQPTATGRVLERGDLLCDLLCDLDAGIGRLSVGTPVPGRVVRVNPRLREGSGRTLREPYGDGWLVELADVDPLSLFGLVSPEDARDRTQHDLARFRQAIALRLFADVGSEDLAFIGDGRLTELPRLLGPADYLELVARFVH
jgi:glycine cleavage system H lipoate-binding protein